MMELFLVHGAPVDSLLSLHSEALMTPLRQALAKKVFGKVVQVDDLGKDRYGRTLGIVRLVRRNVNLELVREGWAWWYRKYAPKNKELASAEAAARIAKRGLWADPKPIPPWDWRQSERDKRLKSRLMARSDPPWMTRAIPCR
jgi:micrococcal nuclease